MIPASAWSPPSQGVLAVTKLSRVLKDYQDAGAFNALVSVHSAIDDHTFLSKGGDLLALLAVRGVDYECLDPVQLDQIARRFESAARIFDENFRLYQYLVKHNSPAIPHSLSENPIVRKAVQNRIAFLQEKAANLYSVEIYFAVAYEGFTQARVRSGFSELIAGPLATLRKTLSSARQMGALESELDRACEILTHKVMSFIVQLQDVIHIEALDKQRGFNFLRQLLNYTPYKVDGVRLKYDQFVDFQACDSALECHRDHLRLDDYYVEALSLKEPPAQTFAHLLRGLQELPCEYVIASEWKRETNLQVRKLIQSKRRHFYNLKTSLLTHLTAGSQAAPKDMLIDDAAVAQVADLGRCLQELEANGRTFGRFSMTIVLYAKDRAQVRRAVAEAFKIFATHDAQLIEETYNTLNAWLAVLPGNHDYNLRSLWVTDANYADLSFLFALHTGETRNAHLGTEYLAVLETNHRTPYYLNLHYQDVAHSLILGATGSGKSFFLNFLLTHLQKYNPLTYIFDLGGSYENLTRLFGGAYLPVGVEKSPFAINPFALPPTPETLQFLPSFLKVLMESDSDRITLQDERDLFEQIRNLYEIEPSQRRLFTLANILNRRLRERLQKWVQGGQYGSLFDNVEDNLTLARFQTFDFEGMEKVPQVLEPLLFYILHRANAAIYDAGVSTTFKIFVMDEAWRFLRHPTLKAYILEALKTWRKKNAAMILATQSGDDLLRSEMLSVVVESCATKMFLANPDMDRKVVNLNVSPNDYWLYTSSPFDRERRRQAFERYGFEKGLEILTRSGLTQSDPAPSGLARSN
jgi:type IV secretion/conjugal transfer VirB4 family ATPase